MTIKPRIIAIIWLAVLLTASLGAVETGAFEGEVETKLTLSSYSALERVNNDTFSSATPTPSFGVALRSKDLWNMGVGGSAEFTGLLVLDFYSFGWDSRKNFPAADTFVIGSFLIAGLMPAFRFFEVLTVGLMAGVTYLSFDGISNLERIGPISGFSPAAFGFVELRFGSVFFRYSNIGEVDIEGGGGDWRFFGEKVAVGVIF